MARKRHSDEDVLKLLREIELKLTGGSDVASACRSVGISDATYYNWRSPLLFNTPMDGGLAGCVGLLGGRSQLP